ncbi:MAG: nicotinate phosphoribosyltransferase [Crocinitomicaceae bacterium]|jgi:nicotinate phosphoribosyltransferase
MTPLMDDETFARLEQPIFFSLADTDKYKLSMLLANYYKFPSTVAKYRFKCRTQGVDLTPLIPTIRRQIEKVAQLSFTDSELRYFAKEKYLTPVFLDLLKGFRLDSSHVSIENKESELSITVEGSMLKTSMWEIFILAMVNELYFRMTVSKPDIDEGRKRLIEKIEMIKSRPKMEGFSIVDFGTRRRFSREWHAEVVQTLARELPEYFVGTSNYYLAKELGIKAIGTMAHEYLQVWQGLVHPLDATKTALNEWADVFRGDLGVALTDVIGMDQFCSELDLFLAKQFEGFRHDSGCPVEWGYKLIKRLDELNIDSSTKSGVWSDGLTVPLCLDLYDEFKGKLKTSFGIGTNLTNDLGYTPLNVVMKIVEANGRPVAKLSDSPGKTMCEDENYVAWLKASYGK